MTTKKHHSISMIELGCYIGLAMAALSTVFGVIVGASQQDIVHSAGNITLVSTACATALQWAIRGN